MTRVNLVPVEELNSAHLLAEFRELKMVPAALKRSLRTNSWGSIKKRIPKEFTLNSGHVLFFFDKMNYLKVRHNQIVNELKQQQFNIDPQLINFDSYIEGLPNDSFGDYNPTSNALAIVRDRIAMRVAEKPDWYAKRDRRHLKSGK